MKSVVRKTHKYLSFFISLQLLLWTISGIYFAFNKIEMVRGGQYLVKNPGDFKMREFNFDVINANEIAIKRLLDKTILISESSEGVKYYDNEGLPLNKLSIDNVKEIVVAATTLTPKSVKEITQDEKGSEYRGRQLPLFKVIAHNKNGDSVNVYVNAHSGEVAAIRSDQWRFWDLMWGFHIMDWIERDNIDNILLKVFSILALVSSVSGILLFFKIDWSGQNL